MMITVLIADDQAMVRAGLRLILEAEDDIVVVAEAENGEEGVRLARRETPDVVLMDVRMPVMDGLEATRQITEQVEGTRVIVLTTFDLDEYVYGSLRSGASGFLLKDADGDQLVEAVRVIAAGDALIAPSVTRRLISEFANRPELAEIKGLDDLTEREVEVLGLVANGLSNTEIGEALFVSESTVKTHVSHILTKLQLRDRVQAVVAAYESGLVTPGS
ncbi:MAG: response regulator transcription factor [Acidobacteria bacterium]|nr:response regulator transcription factor [Acidobacteriota bacterium]TDI49110.1 MAG: response regulator transcription factor [Acidobacteriota bacterium]TDI56349.1 MAG: response regulator transcription factor [Acidobacteriota bacterium]